MRFYYCVYADLEETEEIIYVLNETVAGIQLRCYSFVCGYHMNVK